MSVRNGSFLLLAVGLFIWGASPLYAAEAAKPTAIAIVDVQRILQDSKAAQSVQKQIETQRSAFQSEIAAEEKVLREAEQKLAKLRESGPADTYAEEEQKLRDRFMKVERQVQSKRKALDQAFTDSMAQVKNGLVSIVEKLSRARGVGLVIVKQQMIWNDQSIDLTQDVLAEMNRTMAEIDVKVAPVDEAEEDKLVLPNRKKTKQ